MEAVLQFIMVPQRIGKERKMTMTAKKIAIIPAKQDMTVQLRWWKSACVSRHTAGSVQTLMNRMAAMKHR